MNIQSVMIAPDPSARSDRALQRAFLPAGNLGARQAVGQSRQPAPNATCRLYHEWTAPFEGLTGGKVSDDAHDGTEASQHSAVRDFAPDLTAVGATTRSMSFWLLHC
jgi:hypothetical protein